MLISMSVENWMSFREKATFSMVKTRESRHGERVPTIRKYHLRLLPITAIYGGNASGKTNFCEALKFAKELVVKVTQPDSTLPVEPFRLDPACSDKPSRFSFELLIEQMIYKFSFAVTRNRVVEEKLVKVFTTRDQVLYHRKDGKPISGEQLKKGTFLDFASQGTRDNQLFLNNAVTQKVELFKPVYDWFKNTLVLIAPNAPFGHIEQFMQKDHPIYSEMSDKLEQLDTGIVHLGGEKVSIENSPLEPLISHIKDTLQEGETNPIFAGSERYLLTRRNDELILEKLATYHQQTNGENIKFDMQHESSGSLRVIDLLPAFLDIAAANSKRVYVIDELDRSLHTMLTRQLLEFYLKTCSEQSRSQLIFTSHDVLLMDQDLLRRDEMWVVERDCEGASSMLSFSEYKDLRYDTVIHKNYLQGRLGGIPRILMSAAAEFQAKAREPQ